MREGGGETGLPSPRNCHLPFHLVFPSAWSLGREAWKPWLSRKQGSPNYRPKEEGRERERWGGEGRRRGGGQATRPQGARGCQPPSH